MRKHYSTTFKAEAVKELMKEEKTISQLASEIGVGCPQGANATERMEKDRTDGSARIVSARGKNKRAEQGT